jgi:nucleotide-binding universal stress UspA family protein
MTILVGVDGSAASLDALDLALGAAALRNVPVRVVYADPWANHPAWIDAPAPPADAALKALDAARERAGPNPAVEAWDVLAGDPGTVLVRESANADLAAVGHRGRGGLPELLLGSVAARLAAHAHCPVLVTRAGQRRTSDAPDIAVGVDGSPAGGAAIGFAFQEAALRGVGLVAVHASTGPDLSGPTDALIVDPEVEQAERHRLLTGALARWRNRYPNVPVREDFRWDRPGRALVDASARVALVVVGARGRGVLAGRRLGSVTHAVLHHAACPVAVIHPDVDS